MKKIDLSKATISEYLAQGFSVYKAASLCEFKHIVRVQPRYVRGVWEFTVYFVRLGNAYEKAGVFYLNSQGIAQLPPPEKKRNKIAEFFDDLLRFCYD